MKKYEFTGETKIINTLNGEITLRRIKASMEFGVIKAGDIGGWIEKEANISENGNAWVCGNAEVWGDAKVYGDAEVWGDAEVNNPKHILVIGAIGSRNDFTTFYRNKHNGITVKCGCFNGEIKEFLKKVQETHGDNQHAIIYKAAAELAKLQIDLS